MTGSWPSAKQVGDLSLAEATGDAIRLGHMLVAFMLVDDTWQSFCRVCKATALVRPRSRRLPRLGGAALTLRCDQVKR